MPEPGSPGVRPFLERHLPESGEDAAHPGAVRPYSLTRGRVASGDPRVRVETVVLARADAVQRVAQAGPEEHRLVALAVRPISVVELSAALAVPVGVVLVLVGDLVRAGVLDLSNPTIAPRDDVVLIRRLIDGVCAL